MPVRNFHLDSSSDSMSIRLTLVLISFLVYNFIDGKQYCLEPSKISHPSQCLKVSDLLEQTYFSSPVSLKISGASFK